MSRLKNASEMARMARMPIIRRASMGRRDRENFIKQVNVSYGHEKFTAKYAKIAKIKRFFFAALRALCGEKTMVRIYIPHPRPSTGARGGMGRFRSSRADGVRARSRCGDRCIARRPRCGRAIARA